MPRFGAVKNEAAVAAQMASRVRNPLVEQTAGTLNRQVVHVTLTYDGVDFDADVLENALTTLGTLVSDKATQTHKIYNFRITP